MKERLPLFVALILVLAVLGAYVNLDLVRPGFQHARWLSSWMSWQGEPAQRRLNLRLGLDLQGGLQILMQVNPQSASRMKPGDLDRAASIIETRVNALGVTEPLVQTQGSDKVVVELPGVSDPDLAKRTVGQTALLEFIYAAERPGEPPLRPGDKVLTSWRTSGKLFDELDPAEQKPVRKVVTETLRTGAEAAPTGAATTGTSAATTPPGVAAAPTGAATSPTVGATAPTAAATAPEGTATTPGAVAAATAALTATQSVGGATGVSTGEAIPATSTVAPTAPVTATASLTATEGAGGTPPAGTVVPTATVTATAGVTETAGREEWIFPTVVTGDYLSQAAVGLDQFNKPAVNFVLSTEGGSRMQRFTKGHIDEVMAIALDGVIISAPVVRDAIADSGEISGNFTRPEAESLVAQLRSGALPVALDIVGETLVGPTLGREFVDDAVRGGLVGLLVVVLFMLVYYRFPGFLADLALCLYVLMVLTLFRMIPVTLTLAGIAGFILSVGMAVDANILIFERLKEELRAGKRILAAIDTGFSRAWPSIRDSNFSTIITCVILFWFGSQFGASIVKGFAVTLALGVIVSLFTAITVTRTLLFVSNRIVLRETDQRGATESDRLRRLFGF